MATATPRCTELNRRMWSPCHWALQFGCCLSAAATAFRMTSLMEILVPSASRTALMLFLAATTRPMSTSTVR